MPSVVTNFHVNFTASLSGLQRATRSALNALRPLRDMVLRLGGLLTGLGGLGLGAGIAKLSLDVENLDLAARRIGATPHLVRMLERIAELTPGLDLQDMLESVNELDRVIGEGKFDLFARLGLGEDATRTLQRAPLELLGQVLDRAARLPRGDRTALLGQIFGDDLGLKLQALKDVRDLIKSQRAQEIAARGTVIDQLGDAGNLRALREFALNVGTIIDQVFRNLSNDEGVGKVIADIRRDTETWVAALGGAEGITRRLKESLKEAASFARDVLGRPAGPDGRLSAASESLLERAFPNSGAVPADALVKALGGTAPELFQGSLLEDAVDWLRRIADNTAKGATFR